MIDGVEVRVDREAVVVAARRPLAVVSSALIGGGCTTASTIVNLHVPKDFPHDRSEALVADFVRRRSIAPPFVGLLTSAWTETAELGEAEAFGLRAMAAVTVGLGNPVAAGWTAAAEPAPLGTINTIVVVDADPMPSALVNAVITVTEVKALALVAAGLRCADGRPASGTSTDAVVIAATGRGPRREFGGPISEVGSVVARAARAALQAGVAAWLGRHT